MPFSDHMKTNIGKTFLNLLEKLFPFYHCLHKIYNKNTMRISYSYVPNMAAILSRHNRSILASKSITVHSLCNCQCKTGYPLNGKCHKKAIIYEASISTNGNNPPKCHYGCCKTEFKSRFSNHCQTFKSKQKRHTTKLFKAFWEAIDNGKGPCIE